MADDEPKTLALFVGVDTCPGRETLTSATADALAMYEVFSSETNTDAKVLTRTAATKHDIASRLTGMANRARPGDRIVFYFAGHSIALHNQLYLATDDLDLTKLEKDMTAGFRVAELRDLIINRGQPDLVLVLLDCCSAGAAGTSIGIDPDLILGATNTRRPNRVALFATSLEGDAREDPNLGHGIFTRHMLDALRGAGVNNSHQCTLSSLYAYLEQNVTGQLIGRAGQEDGLGPVVLTTPRTVSRRATVPLPDGDLPLERETRDFAYLDGPLDGFEVTLDSLLDAVRGAVRKATMDAGGAPSAERLLSESFASVKRFTGATFVAVLALVGDHFELVHNSFDQGSEESATSILSSADNADLVNAFHRACMYQRRRFGFIASSQERGKHYLGVPVDAPAAGLRGEVELPGPDRILFLGPVDSAHSACLTEAFCLALSAVFKTSGGFGYFDWSTIEAGVLDAMRSSVTVAPSWMYARRLTLYLNAVESLTMLFQPIGAVAPPVSILSFEALARDRDGLTPERTFHVAELWGTRFRAELDATVLRKTLERARLRPDTVVSMNLYPSSLVSEEFIEALKAARDAEEFPLRNLVLEISEKMELPIWSERLSEVESFRRHMSRLATDFGISYAIDDFGVRHSSISRVSDLQLRHIKLDRELLRHKFAEATVGYVVKMAEEMHTGGGEIIVEGFDYRSRLTVDQLRQAKVKGVQGFALREPQPEMTDLTAGEKKLLRGGAGGEWILGAAPGPIDGNAESPESDRASQVLEGD